MKNAYKAKKRNAGNRQRKRIILIATEGANKTETNYFKGFNSKETKIVFVSGNETDPVNMANNLVAEYEKNGLDEKLGDLAFYIVDGDLSRDREKQICEADKILRKTGKTIVSNPCIEVWFLCHYTDSTKQYMSSSEVENRIREYLPEYRKSMKGLKDILDEHIDKAVLNAKRLDVYNQQAGKKLHTYDYQPATEVYKIIEELHRVSKE